MTRADHAMPGDKHSQLRNAKMSEPPSTSVVAACAMQVALVGLFVMCRLVYATPPSDPEQSETLEFLEGAWAHRPPDEKATYYRKLGRLVASIDRPENALVYYDRAVAIHEGQIRDEPDVEDHWLAMADTLHAKARGLLYLERPRLAEALRTCEQAISLAQKTLEKATPGKSDARSLLANAEMTLAEIQIARADFAAAKAALERIGRREPVAAFMRQCLEQARTRTRRLSPDLAGAGDFAEWVEQSLRRIERTEASGLETTGKVTK